MKKENKPDDTKIVSLYDRLLKYKSDVLGTDSSIRATFSNNLILTTKSFDESKPTIAGFKKTFFHHASHVTIAAILAKFQNNIKIIENNFVIFCNENIGVTGD